MATFAFYGKFLQGNADGSNQIDWDTDAVGGSIRVALTTASYTPNVDSDQYWGVASGNEVTGSGYNANGTPITTRSVTLDTTNNRVGLIGDDTTWGTATISGIRYAVVFRAVPAGSASSPLICYADLGAQSVTGANFTLDYTSGTVGYYTY